MRVAHQIARCLLQWLSHVFLSPLGAAFARQVTPGRRQPPGCAHLSPRTVDSRPRDCPELSITNQRPVLSAAQAAGSGEAGAGGRHRWHAAQRTLTGGAQTLKQVVAPPYCFHTTTIAVTVHEQVHLPRAGPAAAAIAHCKPRGPLYSPPRPPTSLLHQAASAAARERRKGRKRSCGSRLVLYSAIAKV